MPQDLDNPLKPLQFDWAEDVEEELEGGRGSNDGLSDGKLEEALASFNGSEGPLSSHKYCSEGQAPEEDTRAANGPLIVNGAVNMTGEEDSDTDSETAGEIESMQLAVNAEFAHRRACLQADVDGAIHHFNWSGYPVYGYNPTPPTVSLLFLLADPKVPPPGHEWRYDSIMRRASVFVDPVIVYLENGWRDLCLRGFDLVQRATGRVFKFYSPHGYWQDDPQDLAEYSVLDDGDLANYASNNLAAANGFIEQFSIRSRAQWQWSRDESFYLARKELKSRRKCFWPSPSPLRQSTTPDEFDEAGKLLRFLCPMKYTILGLTNVIEHEEIVVERPPSRLSHKRSFHESFCPPSGALKRRPSIWNYKSEEDSDDGHPETDNIMQMSDEKQATAGEIKPRKVRREDFSPTLETIYEDDELCREAEKGSNGYISSSTQTVVSGLSNSATSLLTPSEMSVPVKPVMKDAQVQTDHEPFPTPAKKDRKWEKGLRRFSNKARKILRPNTPQFSLAHGYSYSSELSTSSTSEPENGTDDSTNTPKAVDSQVSVVKHFGSAFERQRASLSTLTYGNEKVSSAKKLATKFKKTLRQSSTEHVAAAPRNKNSFSGFCKDFFFEGVSAMGPYSVYPLIL